MTRPHPSQPNPAIQRLYQEAELAWEQLDYPKSIHLIELATRKDPRNPSLLLDLARAYGRRFDFPAAGRCLEKAVQISGNRAQTLAEAGQVCLQFDKIEMGIAYLERACQKKGVSIGTLTTLVDIYLRDRRIDEAAELLERYLFFTAAVPDRMPGGIEA